MWKFAKRNKSQKTDRFEAELFDALAPSDHDVTRAAENPFLLRRLMVAIGEEQRRRNQSAAVWSVRFGVALRATPALAAIALLFFCLFWFSARSISPNAPLQDKVFRAEANSVATTELPMISNEDLMSIMLTGRAAEPRRGQIR
jgi:hypothetical protein